MAAPCASPISSKRDRPNFSFEFFPPQDDDGVAALFDTIAALRELDAGFRLGHLRGGRQHPGADASSWSSASSASWRSPRSPTSPARAAAGPSCTTILGRIVDAGIENVLALRGDPPRGEAAFIPEPGGLAHGSELVALVSGVVRPLRRGGLLPRDPPGVGLARRRAALDQGEGGAGSLVPDHPALLRQPGVLRLRRPPPAPPG